MLFPKEYFQLKQNTSVFYTRYEKNAGSDDDTILTYVGNRVFTFICNILFQLNISDVLFTYVMGSTKVFRSLKIKSKDFSFCVELPVKAKFKNYKFIKGDIGDNRKTKLIFSKFKPNYVINFAAETHVDRSIDNPSKFIDTNILGVFNLLKTALNYWKKNFKKS